jgi:short-subunit dehydrogenase
MSTLEDQVAVVTGASSGIGKAIALELATHGAGLCLVGRKLDTLQSVADAAKAKARASQSRCYQADLAVGREVTKLIADIKRDIRSVDILVHCAGIIKLGPIESTDAVVLDGHYRINLRAPYVLTQGLLPALKARPGQLLFVNSSVGLAAKANASQYSASKHALKAIADSLREEVNPAGIRVLSLFLGRAASPMQAAIHAAEARAYVPQRLMQPEDIAALAIHALTLPRSIEVTEICMRPLLRSS